MAGGIKFLWPLCLAVVTVCFAIYSSNVHAAKVDQAKVWAVGMTWLCSVFQCDPKEYRDLRNASPHEYSRLVDIAKDVAILVKTRQVEVAKIAQMKNEDRTKLMNLLGLCISEVKRLRGLEYIIPSKVVEVLEGGKKEALHETKYSNYPMGVPPLVMKSDDPAFPEYSSEERKKLEDEYTAQLNAINNDIKERFEKFKSDLEQEKNYRIDELTKNKKENIVLLEERLKEEGKAFEEGMKLYGKISSDLTHASVTVDTLLKHFTGLDSHKDTVNKISHERRDNFEKLVCSMESKDLYGLQNIINKRPEWKRTCDAIRTHLQPVCESESKIVTDLLQTVRTTLLEAPQSGLWFEKRGTWYTTELDRLEQSARIAGTSCEVAYNALQSSLEEFASELILNDATITECTETLIKSSFLPAQESLERFQGSMMQLRKILDLSDVLESIEATVENCLKDTATCQHLSGNISSSALQRIQDIMAAEELVTQNERKMKATVQYLNLLQPLLDNLEKQKFEIATMNDVTELNASVANDKREVLKLVEMTKEFVGKLKHVSEITSSMMEIGAGLSRGSDPAFSEAALDRYQKELSERLNDGQRYGKELESVIDEQAEVKSKLRVLEKQAGQIRGMGMFGGPTANSELQALEEEIGKFNGQNSELGYRATHLSNQLSQAREDVQTLRKGIAKCKHYIEQNEKSATRLRELTLEIRKSLSGEA